MTRTVAAARSLALPIRTDRRGRLLDVIALTMTAAILAVTVVQWVPLLFNLDPAKIAIDFNLYVDATRRALNGGAYYLAYQLEGPYDATPGVILYPPPFILVMIPFAILPWPVYWLLPIGAVAWGAWVFRPRITWWPVIAFCIWWPGTLITLVAGNPVLLFTGAMALATLRYWPAAWILLKPSLFPFALFGIWTRAWWAGLGLFVLVSIPFGLMWLDYAAVLLNARHELGLLYNIGQAPTLAIPLAIWAGRTRPARGFTLAWPLSRVYLPARVTEALR